MTDLVLTLNVFATTDPGRLRFVWTVIDGDGAAVTTQEFTRTQIAALHTELTRWLEATS